MDLADLGTPALSWSRAYRLIQQIIADPGTATGRALLGEQAPWDLAARLLARVEHTLRVLVWMQTKDATKKQPENYPEPILPPGVEMDGVQRWGTERMTLDEAREWLGWAA